MADSRHPASASVSSPCNVVNKFRSELFPRLRLSSRLECMLLFRCHCTARRMALLPQPEFVRTGCLLLRHHRLHDCSPVLPRHRGPRPINIRESAYGIHGLCFVITSGEHSSLQRKPRRISSESQSAATTYAQVMGLDHEPQSQKPEDPQESSYQHPSSLRSNTNRRILPEKDMMLKEYQVSL